MNIPRFPLPNLSYDGEMDQFFQFTERDVTSPSHGATFYVEQDGFTLQKLQAKRDFKRLQFNMGLVNYQQEVTHSI